jgi:hypothetical protein
VRKIDVRSRPSPARCAVCHDTDDGQLSKCHRCGVLLHFECFPGKCPTIGCIEGPPPSSIYAILVEHERGRRDRVTDVPGEVRDNPHPRDPRPRRTDLITSFIFAWGMVIVMAWLLAWLIGAWSF